MNQGVYNPSQVFRKPQNLTNATSSHLFNRNNNSVPFGGYYNNNLYSTSQQVYYQPTYPTAYQSSYRPSFQPNSSPLNYSLPPNQTQSPNGLPSTTLNYYQLNPNPTFNSLNSSGSGITISSKGLESILIAILILVALDLVVIRPSKNP